MGKGYILVEGHGETGAAENLVTRLWANLGLEHLVWKPSARLPNIQYEKGIRKGCNRVRAKGDAAALLIICDDDDGCPRETAPGMARWVAAENLPFPAALVLMHREYEVLFLPCVHLMAGKPLCDPRGIERPGLLPGTRFDGIPQHIRGVKEWLTRHLPQRIAYKPTLDQLPMTRMIDFELLRNSEGIPCFGTLERALRFISERLGSTGVYPPPSQDS